MLIEQMVVYRSFPVRNEMFGPNTTWIFFEVNVSSSQQDVDGLNSGR